MTGAALAAVASDVPGTDHHRTHRLRALISPQFLAEAGWVQVRKALVFPTRHPLLGWDGPADPLADWAARVAAGSGSCAVGRCPLDRQGNGSYCELHRVEWRATRGPSSGVDEAYWRTVVQAELVPGMVSLHGLPELVVAELLYGLQHRCRRGARTSWRALGNLVRRIRMAGAASMEDLPPRSEDSLHSTIVAAVRQAVLDPEIERRKDVWQMSAFGYGGTLDFSEISQGWLREAVKRWALDFLPTRQGKTPVGKVRARVMAVAKLSASLRLQRQDRGEDFTILGAADISAFCNRLAFLQAQGVVSARLRLSTCLMARVVLDGIRRLGLTRPGQPLSGLPDDFAIRRGQIPDDSEDDEPGKDLPKEVMQVICRHLPQLGQQANDEIQTAVELLIDTGRRPSEICALAWDCLQHDADGQPVLIYDNVKSKRFGRRLPVATTTADLIRAAQARARQRFPDTPVGELKLLPSTRNNPHGHRPISPANVSSMHRRWIMGLPQVTVATETTSDGKAVVVSLPYDMATITVYAYRHTYAQRHADAGVPVDVLRELLDHLRMDTTQRYYRIGEKRRREAVDRVALMQFDRHGSRIWRDATALLDDERMRLAVGEVAVPYGGCSEPSNVNAGGGACPIRFRCVGCGHFRTDASYLPDLEAYLADLLRNRERILATGIDADDWARAEALPSTEEITRVQRLITRIKGELDDLTDAEREQIEQAVAVVRRGRIALRITPTDRRPHDDLRPARAA
ncbi:tyrosine-type recombinase/integrase [Catellatospora bangladeshensis]|uniref:Tyr recombinase domain-containing protein n=1 Tax=Catellatospora bangladeshensis TaxID=310355 RepID=A0A8J3NNF9_9ACTN|nr:tyrosine-type recombinase/integrase [Catellatospora bangladeshensis]GIF86053.1 hypothetical protein Cba03nite_74020 [Catellatospora bangladeshensis]